MALSKSRPKSNHDCLARKLLFTDALHPIWLSLSYFARKNGQIFQSLDVQSWQRLTPKDLQLSMQREKVLLRGTVHFCTYTSLFFISKEKIQIRYHFPSTLQLCNVTKSGKFKRYEYFCKPLYILQTMLNPLLPQSVRIIFQNIISQLRHKYRLYGNCKMK